MRKSFIILLTIFICIFCSTSITYANDIDLIGDAKDWINIGRNEHNRANIERTSFNDFAGILWGLGMFVVLIIGTVLGIKYMLASVEEKASIKESIKPYIIGTVIILGALTIWRILVEFMDELI